TYQEVFDALYILEVPGTSNRILLALPRKQSIDRAQLVQLARRLGTEKRFAFDPGDITEDQFRSATRKGTSGRVLRDVDTAQPVRTP
ncbi:MAG: hypothetical protein QOK44_847, partial [Betaproteobacteria bacterium]|nr:hypothetical protein [Betaproteobacteria bacterium]